jgi:hypothetical protein
MENNSYYEHCTLIIQNRLYRTLYIIHHSNKKKTLNNWWGVGDVINYSTLSKKKEIWGYAIGDIIFARACTAEWVASRAAMSRRVAKLFLIEFESCSYSYI